MGVGLTTWRAVAASVVGSGHRGRGAGCEDASAVDTLPDGSVVIAVGDGAGSARLAAEGSARAVAAAIGALREGVAVAEVLALARAALEPTDEEAEAGVALADRATTLLVVRAGPEGVATAQVGDGAVVVRRVDGTAADRLEVVGADVKGEYLNETCFLTSPSWKDGARVTSMTMEGVDAIAALTDGLQLVAFDMAAGTPHAPFFDPFFSFVAGGGDVGQLSAFLASDRVAARTDDDVTLALATLAPS